MELRKVEKDVVQSNGNGFDRFIQSTPECEKGTGYK